MSEDFKKSWHMHKALYQVISDQIQGTKDYERFEHAISLTPSDKAEHKNSVIGLLGIWEMRGKISLGNYEELLKLLRNTQLIKVLEIAKTKIALIIEQLNIETGTTTSQARMTHDPGKDYIPTKTPDELKLIQRELHDRYIDTLSRLHPIPWCEWLELDLDHVYTNLEMMPGRKHQLCPRLNSDYGNIPTLGCLFNKESRNRSVCLIEGPAGIGKSTLCRRLVYLWSNNNYSIDDHSFDLAFLLEAKLLTDNLNNCVIEQLFPKDFELSEDSIYQSLRNCQKKCLLIIDGIDELTSEGKTLVMELLKCDKLRNINLLLTGRPEASREYVKYVNKHFRINGFSFKNVKEYICKYFGSNDNTFKDMLLKRVQWDRELKTIMTNPLTTVLVCFIVEDNEGDVPANFIDICNKVLQACCRKYVTKVREGSENKGKEGSGVASLSNDNLFSAAGHLAYNGIKQRITAYPEDTLASFCPDGFSEHLLKSGILSKDFTVSRLNPKSFCYFPHKSFQEFMCAKHLAALHLGEFKENIFPFSFNKNIVRFLLGMLQCQAKTKVVLENLYLARVKRHRQSIYVQLGDLEGLEGLLNLLHECNTSEDLLELLVQIISTSDWAITDISFISNYNILKQKYMSAKLKGDFVHHELEKRKSTPFFRSTSGKSCSRQPYLSIIMNQIINFATILCLLTYGIMNQIVHEYMEQSLTAG